MHCMVRGQLPEDYLVMVPASSESIDGLAEKAQALLQAGQSAKSSVRLTRREEEVLDGISRSLANKEIATELNLSERTVKFHVSSLLAKFKVRGRLELMRETSRHSLNSIAPATAAPVAQFAGFPRQHESHRRPVHSGKILPLARHRMMA